MPKRPCAVVISPDDNDIYSADKFGDVYSLPLLMNTEDEEAFLVESKKAAEPKAYAPSATEQTVHSKANLRALDAQLKQAKGEKKLTKPKESLTFSHQLLLGHVSLLTDLLVTTIRPNESTEKPRTYLITSDRDEHIRISRGPPQSYVIEGFCLGHHEFINKICLVEPGLLVSGGGEDELFVWDWLQQKLVNRVNISKAVHKMRRNLAREKVIDADVEMGESDVRHIPDEQKIEQATEAVVEKIESEGQQELEPSSPLAAEHKAPRVAVTNLWRFTSSSMGKVAFPSFYRCKLVNLTGATVPPPVYLRRNSRPLPFPHPLSPSRTRWRRHRVHCPSRQRPRHRPPKPQELHHSLHRHNPRSRFYKDRRQLRSISCPPSPTLL